MVAPLVYGIYILRLDWYQLCYAVKHPVVLLPLRSSLDPISLSQSRACLNTLKMRTMIYLFRNLLMLIFGLHAIAIPYSTSSTIAEVEIENTLNLFSYYVDTHNYAMLDLVFSSDAVADFATSAGYIKGLNSIQQGLEATLGGTASQHALSTYIINVVDDDGMEATAISYLQGTIFGQANLTGQYLITYGL